MNLSIRPSLFDNIEISQATEIIDELVNRLKYKKCHSKRLLMPMEADMIKADYQNLIESLDK